MSNAKTTDAEILEELRRMTKLLVLIATKDQPQREQIEVISGIGFQPKEIAELLGITANAVRVTLFNIRRRAKAGGKGKDKRSLKKDMTNDE